MRFGDIPSKNEGLLLAEGVSSFITFPSGAF